MKRTLNNTQTAMLKEGYSTGIKHASFEIDKVKKSAFSRTMDMSRVNFIAEDYFKTLAFKITGDLTNEAVKIIEQSILNGARYDKTWEQVEKDISSYVWCEDWKYQIYGCERHNGQ